ncbi:MAG: cob(I)yrinic acid a,c-diamide adenosyltransferase [Nitrospina sp.]|jgi:cob(I)alamin adenosyltransferase|nr:cob(I)yrinic acid a,c-diamide adenosyltransferase [Nitrospina sp.]MBT3414217.1 cob(I)yrinic acid a,c-diamide adenosyltransferase [Nitrospina sp.]MBT3857281.1 cob(I)yrinic acid a,c-diamide adenosyltransferase [Nitrospina sp.]MBT4103763.1 cob(I)yrinic acid a,c-diamide adenosyltransferase [Nitrospina sp.]MBT4389053.1 cob(I)yrinic acid a,c-diamide adenosyltransferase [Nitrospina sp.]
MRKPSGADPKKRKGLIIVNTGDGKGKSTAAFGLAMRAAGNKMNVFIMQFMKGQWKAGERKAFEKLAPYVEVIPMGDGFTWDTENIEQDKATARKAFEIVKEKLLSEKYQMVIFEEINYVLHYQFFPEDEFLELLKNKPEKVHVVCTGRNASDRLIEIADLVTEMKMIKHPFKEQGIPAQKGIEF